MINGCSSQNIYDNLDNHGYLKNFKTKIAIVDFEAIFRISKDGIDAQNQMKNMEKQLLKQFKKDLQVEEKILYELKIELQKCHNFICKAKYDKEIFQQQVFIKDLNDEYLTEFHDYKTKLVNQIKAKLDKVLYEFGKKNNLLFIFEKREAGVLFYKKSIDITKQVISIYDRIQ